MANTHRNTLHTTTTSKTTNGRFGNALDVVAKNLAMTLGTTFAEAFATFTACICVSIESVEERDTVVQVQVRIGDVRVSIGALLADWGRSAEPQHQAQGDATVNSWYRRPRGESIFNVFGGSLLTACHFDRGLKQMENGAVVDIVDDSCVMNDDLGCDGKHSW